jgi:sarcosine oxidase subunit gamma
MSQALHTDTHAFRSILEATHTGAGAQWEVANNSRVVASYGETELERGQAFRRLALLDLSPLPRFGLKGVNTTAWLASRDVVVGDISNQAYPQGDGSLVARLSQRELLFLCEPSRPVMSMHHDYFTPGRECYTIRRQDTHYWFALSGAMAPPMLAKLCGVNFSPSVFANHRVAQTQVAGTSTVVVRHDMRETLAYYLLGDSACSTFMWNCLVDAMQEYDGRRLGVQALR